MGSLRLIRLVAVGVATAWQVVAASASGQPAAASGEAGESSETGEASAAAGRTPGAEPAGADSSGGDARAGEPADADPSGADARPGEPAAGAGATAAAERPIDVVIEGERQTAPARGAGQQYFKRREIERIPGAFGDPFRAIEALPGVAPMITGLPHFVVRGTMPAASGYFIDEIRVPFLFHLGVGPSVVNPAMIQGMDFFPGPYPAAYGQHTGGIIAARTRPPYPRIRAEANIRVFDAGAFAEVPFLEGKASAFAGARYSYTAAALALFSPQTRLSYWDYQAGGGYQLTKRDRVSLMAFGSDDYLGEIEADDSETELFAAQFHRLHLRYDHTPPTGEGASEEPRSRSGATFGYDRTGLGSEGVMEVFGFGLRTDGELPLAAEVFGLRLGGEFRIDEHEFERSGEDGEPEPEEPDDGELVFDIGDSFGLDRTAAFGGYIELPIRPLHELEIVPGIRTDVFTEDGYAEAGVDPRGIVKIRPVDEFTTVSAFGISHQRPALLVAVPGLDPQALKGGLQRAIQLSQGVELGLPAEIRAELTFFHHWFHNLSDFTATCTVGVQKCELTDRADGRSYGLEVLVRRSLTERIGGLVSYTLSRSERTLDDETTLADFDRTHVLHLALGVELGRGWHAGGRLTAYSGRPYSKVSFDDPADPTHPTLIGRRNALRRPAFLRIDARLEKRWHFAETGWVSLVFEGMNVTLSKEIVDFDCRVQEVLGGSSGLTCGGQEIGPITIPSVGVSGGF